MKMLKSFQIKDSWGVTSVRQCTGFIDGVEYVAPLGCSLIKWDLNTEISNLHQIHDDLIVVMLISSTGNILTVCYSGEVKLWNKSFDMHAHFHLPTDNVVYGSWSPDGDEFGVTSKGPNQQSLVYNYSNVIQQYQRQEKVTSKWSCKAPQLDRGGGDHKDTKRKTYDCFNAVIFKENNEVILVYQSLKICQLLLLSTNGDILKKSIVSPLGDESNDMICVTEEIKHNIIAVGLHRGIFGFYDVDLLLLLRVIQAIGAPRVCLWSGDLFIAMSYTSGILTLWNKDGHLIQEVKGGPTGSIVQINQGPTDKSTLYLGGIMSLHKVQIQSGAPTMKRVKDISYLSLTGCGVAVSNENIIACGDLTGKVILWRAQCRSPIASVKVESSVRCLLWLNKETLLIGTLSAQLFCWQNANTKKNSKVRTLYNFIGDVTCLGCNSTTTKLAVGTTAGYLYMFSVLPGEGEEEIQIAEDYSIQIHNPKSQIDGGQLNMEIWSLVWSPDDLQVATTSEDQTTVISVALTGEITHTLTGHTTAVTDVAWEILPSGKHVLATCADDQTLRFYDGEEDFKLLCIVNTHDIYGWHTLTYLCINTNKNLVFVVTQHGYLVAWDLDTFERVCCGKMHAGSIEGLALSPSQEYLVTIGSDCVVNCFAMNSF